jgi:hypothetical protein
MESVIGSSNISLDGYFLGSDAVRASRPSSEKLFLEWHPNSAGPCAPSQFSECDRAPPTLNQSPLQREFLRRVADYQTVEAQQEKSARRLDDLFQSTLHSAFAVRL